MPPKQTAPAGEVSKTNVVLKHHTSRKPGQIGTTDEVCVVTNPVTVPDPQPTPGRKNVELHLYDDLRHNLLLFASHDTRHAGGLLPTYARSYRQSCIAPEEGLDNLSQ